MKNDKFNKDWSSVTSDPNAGVLLQAVLQHWGQADQLQFLQISIAKHGDGREKDIPQI